MNIENQNNYRSDEERIAAEQFNKEKAEITESDDDNKKLLLELLSHFQRTETEQFVDTNENIQKFVDEVDKKFSGKDRKEIYDALTLMFTAHIYQKDRPDNEPYVSHPIAVAYKVANMLQNPDKELVIAALMHDSVEDQADKIASISKDKDPRLTEQQQALLVIKNRYGERVSSIVSQLSNPDFDTILENRGITKENPQFTEEKNKLYAEHVAEAIKNTDVLFIKLADFSENALKLSSLPIDTESQRTQKHKFIAKYSPVMKIFLNRLQRDNLFPEYQQALINEYNNSKGVK